MGITAIGTGSGIDIESLITKLMDAEKTSLTKLDTRETSLQSKISLIGQFKSLVYDLKAAGTKLQNLSNLNGIKTTVGNADALAVVAENNAAVGKYTVAVKQLAQSQQVVSNAGLFDKGADTVLVGATSGVATAKITLNFGTVGDSFVADSSRKQEISIEAGADGKITLQDVADAVNGGDYGVKASLINDGNGVRLSLAGDDTGAENAFSVGVSYLDSSGSTMTPTTTPDLSKLAFDPKTGGTYSAIPEGSEAQNSIMTLNGVEITRSGNTVDDAVDGLAFDLLATTTTTVDGVETAKPTTVTIARDSSTISTQLQTFVDAYNQLASTISTNTTYDAKNKTGGALQGEASIRGLQNQFRSLLSQSFGENGSSVRTLSDLGISFQKDGTLALDSTKLKKTVTENLDDVIDFFGAFDQTSSTVVPEASKKGFAYQLEQLSKSLLADDGLINARLSGLNKSVEDIDDQRERINTRLESVEARYRAQFTAMDIAVANLQGLSGYVTQLLESTSSSSSS